MKLMKRLKGAYQMVMLNRLHSSLTVLGLTIGSASVIVMLGLGQGVKRLIVQELQGFGPHMLYIIPDSRNVNRSTDGVPRTLVLGDAEAIATQVPSVEKVAPQIRRQEVIIAGSEQVKTQVVGTNPAFLAVRNFAVAPGGQFLTQTDLARHHRVAVLGPELAERLFGVRSAIGETVRIKGIAFTVIGVMQPKGTLAESNQDGVVFVPLTTMASQLVGETSPFGIEVSTIAFSAVDEASVRTAEFQVSNLLRLRHKIIDQDDFVIHTQQQFLETSDLITTALILLLISLAGISLLVGGIGIMNIMLISIKARTAEIGLRKAVGASEWDILAQFLLEAILLTGAGGGLGTTIGAGGMLLLTLTTPVNAVISPLAVGVAVGISGGIGIVFGVLPARRAARLDPIAALRSH